MENIKLVNLLELSRKLRIPSKWLKNEAHANRIPHLQVGRKLLFNLQAVENVLTERASQGGINASGK